jgi:hypothetical protein
MGLFDSAGSAKANFVGDYPKPGQYIIIINNAKYNPKSFKGAEQGIFETSVVHVVDKALWTGDPKAVPTGKDGQHLLNIPGQEYKPGNPVSFIFSESVVGNANRHRKFIITGYDVKDEQFPTGAAGAQMIQGVYDPAKQPLKNIMIEVKAGETQTKSKDKIVGANYLRRVYAEEIRQMWEQGKLEPATIELLSKDDRLTKMLATEAQEKANRQALFPAAVGK